MGLVGRLMGLPWRLVERLMGSRPALPPAPPSIEPLPAPAAWRAEPDEAAGGPPAGPIVALAAAASVADLHEDGEGEEEVSLEEAVARAERHLTEGSEYLAAILEVWEDLSDDQRGVLQDCLRYFAEVYEFLGRS